MYLGNNKARMGMLDGLPLTSQVGNKHKVKIRETFNFLKHLAHTGLECLFLRNKGSFLKKR